MNRYLSMKRLGVLFVGLFAVISTGTLVFQHFWMAGERKCAADGQWYFAEEKRCVTPIYIPRITGRPAGVSRLEASEANIREVVKAEDEAARREAAAAADATAQRQVLDKTRPAI